MTIHQVPQHIAIIMDGNGRWAKQRLLPRFMGHRAGVEALRRVLGACHERHVKILTVFAFSSENWRRPPEEVNLLMQLFMRALEQEVTKLHQNNVRLRIIGKRTEFSSQLQEYIAQAEKLTENNSDFTLVIAANYGGHWDISQAMQRLAEEVKTGILAPEEITESLIRQYLCLADLPEPDLFIRTGGEQRISNFLLWQLAYTEMYFTDTLWPDFNKETLEKAIDSFNTRQRRFGRTGEQVAAEQPITDPKKP